MRCRVSAANDMDFFLIRKILSRDLKKWMISIRMCCGSKKEETTMKLGILRGEKTLRSNNFIQFILNSVYLWFFWRLPQLDAHLLKKCFNFTQITTIFHTNRRLFKSPPGAKKTSICEYRQVHLRKVQAMVKPTRKNCLHKDLLLFWTTTLNLALQPRLMNFEWKICVFQCV